MDILKEIVSNPFFVSSIVGIIVGIVSGILANLFFNYLVFYKKPKLKICNKAVLREKDDFSDEPFLLIKIINECKYPLINIKISLYAYTYQDHQRTMRYKKLIATKNIIAINPKNKKDFEKLHIMKIILTSHNNNIKQIIEYYKNKRFNFLLQVMVTNSFSNISSVFEKKEIEIVDGEKLNFSSGEECNIVNKNYT